MNIPTPEVGQLGSIDEVCNQADKNSTAKLTARLLTGTSKVFSMQHRRVQLRQNVKLNWSADRIMVSALESGFSPFSQINVILE